MQDLGRGPYSNMGKKGYHSIVLPLKKCLPTGLHKQV